MSPMGRPEVTREEAEAIVAKWDEGRCPDDVGRVARTVLALYDRDAEDSEDNRQFDERAARISQENHALIVAQGESIRVLRECIERFKDGWRAEYDQWVYMSGYGVESREGHDPRTCRGDGVTIRPALAS